MPNWDADQYLQFADERTRPCRDLVAGLNIDSPRTIADLGCGPGNSTAVLAERWPGADIVGVDSSRQMIDAAHRAYPRWKWHQQDIAAWAPDAPVNLVFSNAALQWVADHEALFVRLFQHVAPGGALAVQMPANIDAPAHVLMRQMAASHLWRGFFQRGLRQWHVHTLPFYYDLLASRAARVDLWETQYLHVLSGAAAIVQWYRGTGLRPFLDALPDDAHRDRFTAEYARGIESLYPPRSDGRVLFPFRRIFVVAYRSAP